MLKLQKDNGIISEMSDFSLRVRKSYSADSLLMKSILEEVSFRNMDLDVKKEGERMGLVLEGDFNKRRFREEGVPLAMPTSPPSVINMNSPRNGNTNTAVSSMSLVCFE